MRIFLLSLTMMLLMNACAATIAPATPSVTLPPPASPTDLVPATATPTVIPTPTRIPKDALAPFTIPGLRARAYPGGQIRLRAQLAKTDVFTRYLIDYPSDGLTITGILQIPAQGEAPFPVILMNHGFFFRDQFRSGDGTDRAAEFLNRRGYITIASDYRSWGGSDYGVSLHYSGLAVDVVNLLESLPSLEQADPSRVGVWGHSMGGGVTMKVLTIVGSNPALEGPSKPTLRAAVLYSTVSADMSDILNRWGLGCFGSVADGETRYDCNSSDIATLDEPSDLLDAYYLTSVDLNLLSDFSPINFLKNVDVPVQINYGTLDGEVYSGTPPDWSKKLYQAFVDAGKPAELFAYDNERHSFVGDAWFAFMERTARFFDENVKNAK